MQLCWPIIMVGENTASIIFKNKMYNYHFSPSWHMAHEHQSTREEIFQATTFETLNIKQKAYENN